VRETLEGLGVEKIDILGELLRVLSIIIAVRLWLATGV
jgi:hypothetical protein